MSKSVNVSIILADKIIQINGLRTTDLQIDYSSDINFTELISELTELIDSGEDIQVVVGDFDESDGKLKIVIETLRSIFDKYSESLALAQEAAAEEEEDLPF